MRMAYVQQKMYELPYWNAIQKRGGDSTTLSIHASSSHCDLICTIPSSSHSYQCAWHRLSECTTNIMTIMYTCLQGFALSDSGSAEQRHTAKAFHAVAVCCNIASVVYYVMAVIALIITLGSIFGTIHHYDGCYNTCSYDYDGVYRCSNVCY